MSEDLPIYEAHRPDGDTVKIWADGRCEGLPHHTVIVNRIPPALNNLQGIIANLRESHRMELKKERDRADRAEYLMEVAQWAVVGIARTRCHVSSMIQDVHTSDLVRASEFIGMSAAKRLLRDAELAFTDHGKMMEMRMHINYLENHAKSRGLQFTPWPENLKDMIPGKWARPSPFGGPIAL